MLELRVVLEVRDGVTDGSRDLDSRASLCPTASDCAAGPGLAERVDRLASTRLILPVRCCRYEVLPVRYYLVAYGLAASIKALTLAVCLSVCLFLCVRVCLFVCVCRV